jgi:hypothetical protein
LASLGLGTRHLGPWHLGLDVLVSWLGLGRFSAELGKGLAANINSGWISLIVTRLWKALDLVSGTPGIYTYVYLGPAPYLVLIGLSLD